MNTKPKKASSIVRKLKRKPKPLHTTTLTLGRKNLSAAKVKVSVLGGEPIATQKDKNEIAKLLSNLDVGKIGSVMVVRMPSGGLKRLKISWTDGSPNIVLYAERTRARPKKLFKRSAQTIARINVKDRDDYPEEGFGGGKKK